MTGRVRQAGSPVPKVSDSDPVPSPVVTRKMTFVEALDIDMAPRLALEKCDPARLKDITYDRLKICVDGGLTRDEIIQAFGTTHNSLKKATSKVKFRFSEMRPGPDPVEAKPKIVPEPETTEPAAVITEPAVSVTESAESVQKVSENVIEAADLVHDSPEIVNDVLEVEQPAVEPDPEVKKVAQPKVVQVKLVLISGNKLEIELPERMVSSMLEELKRHQRQYRGILANHIGGELIAVDMQEVVMMQASGLDTKLPTPTPVIESERYKVECRCGTEYFCVLGAERVRARCRSCNEIVFADRNVEKIPDPRDGESSTLMTNKYFVESYTPLAQRCEHVSSQG